MSSTSDFNVEEQAQVAQAAPEEQYTTKYTMPENVVNPEPTSPAPSPIAAPAKMQLSTKDVDDLTKTIEEINTQPPIEQISVVEDDGFLKTLDGTKMEQIKYALNSKGELTQKALSIINRKSSSDYDEQAWVKFIQNYATQKGLDVQTLMTDFKQATPKQKKELYTYVQRDPSVIGKLSLSIFDDINNFDRGDKTKLSSYNNKAPIILLTDGTNDLGITNVDKDLLMLNDGGVISGAGVPAVWDNKTISPGEFKLGFREANWVDTNRLLQNDFEGLTRAMSSPKALFINKTTGGKSKKLKRKSNSKTKKIKSKSKSKKLKRKIKSKSKRRM